MGLVLLRPGAVIAGETTGAVVAWCACRPPTYTVSLFGVSPSWMDGPSRRG